MLVGYANKVRIQGLESRVKNVILRLPCTKMGALVFRFLQKKDLYLNEFWRSIFLKGELWYAQL